MATRPMVSRLGPAPTLRHTATRAGAGTPRLGFITIALVPILPRSVASCRATRSERTEGSISTPMSATILSMRPTPVAWLSNSPSSAPSFQLPRRPAEAAAAVAGLRGSLQWPDQVAVVVVVVVVLVVAAAVAVAGGGGAGGGGGGGGGGGPRLIGTIDLDPSLRCIPCKNGTDVHIKIVKLL